MLAQAIRSVFRTGRTPGPTDDFWYRPAVHPTAAGISVNDSTALTLSTWWACVRVLTDTVGCMPLHVYRRRGDDRKDRDRKHLWYDPLHNAPNVWQSPIVFKSMLVGHLLLRGNFYARIDPPQTLRPNPSLVPLNPDRMGKPNQDRFGYVHYEYTYLDGKQETFAQEEILHVKLLTMDGITGMSPLTYARESIGLATAQTGYAASIFSGGGFLKYYLKTTKRLGAEGRKNFRDGWRDLHGDPRHFEPPILEDDMDIHTLGMNNEDAQFLESRKFSAYEICQFLGVPPHMVFLMDRATWCLPGDSLIYCEHGPKPIADVQTGELVWSRDNDQWVLSRVQRTGCTGVDEILTIRAGIRTLRCNARHRVPVRRKVLRPYTGGRGRYVVLDGKKFRQHWEVEWVPAGEIKVGDYLLAAHGLASTGKRSSPTRQECSIEFMESLGMIVGDGYFGRGRNRVTTTFGISHEDNASYLPHYVSAIENEFLAWDGPYGAKHGSTVAVKSRRRDKTTTAFHSRHACAELEACGISGTAKTKSIPEWIFDLDEDLKLAFLRGYLDADGTVSKQGYIRYVSVNKRLLEQVRHLCMGIGIRVANVYSANIASEFDGVKRQHMLYSIDITNPHDCERIGTHTDLYKPRMRAAVDRITGRRNCTLYPCEARQRATEPGIAYTMVESIERGPVVPVYDLDVENTHTFIADGVLVHNSNTEQMGIEFLTIHLNPYLVRIEQELQPILDDTHFAEFLRDAIVRGDINSRYQAYNTGLQAGFLTRNEVRARENLDPVPGGDELLTPLNMGPLGQRAPQQPPPPARQDAEEDEGEESNARATAQFVTLQATDFTPVLEAISEPTFESQASTITLEPLIADAASRIVHTEVSALRRQIKRAWHAEQPAAFFRWSVEWFEKHRDYVTKAVAPLYAAAGSESQPTEFAESYCSSSVQEFASGDPSEILTQWETNKAGRLATQLQEILQCTTES